MGYSTVKIDKSKALSIVKQSKASVDSASTEKWFYVYPNLSEIVSACESDHGHIMFNLVNLEFIDYKLERT